MRRVVLALVLTVLTAMLLAGDGPWAGRVLWAATPTHGLHVGDLPVLTLWVVGLAACVTRRPGR